MQVELGIDWFSALKSSVPAASRSLIVKFSEYYYNKMVETDLHESNSGETEPTTELKQRKLVNNTVKYQANGLPASKVCVIFNYFSHNIITNFVICIEIFTH